MVLVLVVVSPGAAPAAGAPALAAAAAGLRGCGAVRRGELSEWAWLVK